MSLHLSKCHIDGNHMSRLICYNKYKFKHVLHDLLENNQSTVYGTCSSCSQMHSQSHLEETFVLNVDLKYTVNALSIIAMMYKYIL